MSDQIEEAANALIEIMLAHAGTSGQAPTERQREFFVRNVRRWWETNDIVPPLS